MMVSDKAPSLDVADRSTPFMPSRESSPYCLRKLVSDGPPVPAQVRIGNFFASGGGQADNLPARVEVALREIGGSRRSGLDSVLHVKTAENL